MDNSGFSLETMFFLKKKNEPFDPGGFFLQRE